LGGALATLLTGLHPEKVSRRDQAVRARAAGRHGGHHLHMENAAAVATLIRQFLAEE
jgi:hypothetical protein